MRPCRTAPSTSTQQSGHAFHWENLDSFNQRVLDFIQDKK